MKELYWNELELLLVEPEERKQNHEQEIIEMLRRCDVKIERLKRKKRVIQR